ncbi:BEL1-like homeodomain protein 6 [Heracleum sosnowskyi]|uniref:BEL1-like homeodomain protein 6 n=1 Tax=Heracleum sosnowskyi TaxID=360622 RepID=A0AAD8NBN1_9APIA|nr:BEL1-like homeodomain protein 6 [Heracleum sosnowskyi]
MATYFPNSSNERDSGPIHYLREPLLNSYSETPVLPGNVMMYMNYPSSSGSYSDTLAGNSQHQNARIDHPSVEALQSSISRQEFISNLGVSRASGHDLSVWRDGRNEMLLMQTMGGVNNTLNRGQDLQGQGLSLSLSPQLPSGLQISSLHGSNPDHGFSSFLSPHTSLGDDFDRNGTLRDDETSQNRQSRNAEYILPDVLGSSSALLKADVSSFGMQNILRNVPKSKYLKAAQQLLDEVVNVRKALKQHDRKKDLVEDCVDVDRASNDVTSVSPAAGQDSNINGPSELTAAEKHELQNKMAKLLSMLDEVDRRYKQYFHQMQIVASSFDVISGSGAAKPYTALALQTISCQFRCLRDAINGQIRVTRVSLREQDGSAVGISRLRYVDQQLRQQRALQQLGVMQQHTWRPQRGLPESSVSILRAWLFEHFLHPYPKDSEKIVLARQTGLTRSQVSNWFINARVRLWKPMVEEMYKEEAGDGEMECYSPSDIAPNATKGDSKTSETRGVDLQNTATSSANEKSVIEQFSESRPGHVPDVDMVGSCTQSSFQMLNHGELEMNPSRVGIDECNVYTNTMARPNGSDNKFLDAYHVPEFGRFGNGNGVSLTLGLQHREDGSMPVSVGTHPNFVTMRQEDVYIGFDSTDSENRQHRLGSSQSWHDFVA